MVEQVSGYDGVELVMGEHEESTAPAVARLDAMLERRVAGEPLQYVLGRWQFLGLDLFVDRRVLVPRPETEVVAQTAIDEALRLGLRRGRNDPWQGTAASHAVADLGTGSGALAIALATELPDVEVWAVDVNDDALAVARANLAGIGGVATRVRLASGSWYGALPAELRGRLRLVVAESAVRRRVGVGVVAERGRRLGAARRVGERADRPRGDRGDRVGCTRLARSSGRSLVCELAPHQAAAAHGLATEAGFAAVEILPDLNGRDRVLVARN